MKLYDIIAALTGAKVKLVDKSNGEVLFSDTFRYEDAYAAVLDGDLAKERGHLIVDYPDTKLVFADKSLLNLFA